MRATRGGRMVPPLVLRWTRFETTLRWTFGFGCRKFWARLENLVKDKSLNESSNTRLTQHERDGGPLYDRLAAEATGCREWQYLRIASLQFPWPEEEEEARGRRRHRWRELEHLQCMVVYEATRVT